LKEKSRQPMFRKICLAGFGHRTVSVFLRNTGMTSAAREDPVPKNLLFSEAGPDG